MKMLLPLAIILLAGCADERPVPSHAETRDSFHQAGGQSDKSYDKENPANPGRFAEPKKE